MRPDTRPVHRVSADGFWVDKTEATDTFDEVVMATGYMTVAERGPQSGTSMAVRHGGECVGMDDRLVPIGYVCRRVVRDVKA
jgi:hypothetical protein